MKDQQLEAKIRIRRVGTATEKCDQKMGDIFEFFMSESSASASEEDNLLKPPSNNFQESLISTPLNSRDENDAKMIRITSIDTKYVHFIVNCRALFHRTVHICYKDGSRGVVCPSREQPLIKKGRIRLVREWIEIPTEKGTTRVERGHLDISIFQFMFLEEAARVEHEIAEGFGGVQTGIRVEYLTERTYKYEDKIYKLDSLIAPNAAIISHEDKTGPIPILSLRKITLSWLITLPEK